LLRQSLAFMREHQRFKFELYHEGACFTARVKGKKRYLLEKAFLENLVTPVTARTSKTSPIPGSSGDFYVLDKRQLAAYSAFRRETSRSERGFPAKIKTAR